MSELEDIIASPKIIRLGKEKLKHRELVLKDLAELKQYIGELVEEEYKESLKICESIPIKEEKDKALSELTITYMKGRRNPEICELADNIRVHIYMLYLAVDKKIKLKDCIKWATPENLAIIQGDIEKN